MGGQGVRGGVRWEGTGLGAGRVVTEGYGGMYILVCASGWNSSSWSVVTRWYFGAMTVCVPLGFRRGKNCWMVLIAKIRKFPQQTAKQKTKLVYRTARTARRRRPLSAFDTVFEHTDRCGLGDRGSSTTGCQELESTRLLFSNFSFFFLAFALEYREPKNGTYNSTFFY